MTAIKENLGGAPEGPAGTGKTETVKDLSKAVAVKILVFNCSEGIDYKSMGNLFRGLASAGAWSCFDEFNRIELEVLSVIAQQILAIQSAKNMQLSAFDFDGDIIPLRTSCNIFITMNPGYVGRAELPDNLKALFRPIAMMIPDYAMIAEIRLYSSGFLEARTMAKKIVATYKLCSEQLSSQSHYDYGMRAVIAVLTAAGRLKKQCPEEREDVIILNAIYDASLPKFLPSDLQLFKWIVADLFPGSCVPSKQERYKQLIDCIKEAMQRLNLQSSDKFIEKILQLYDTINSRHGLMIVGECLTGKSTLYKVLSAALNLASAKEYKEYSVDYFVLNPKAVPLSRLYGSLDRISQEWSEGILSRTFRDCATQKDTAKTRKWIILDGPVDTLWVENMNTVLDDNRMLCLMNGDIIAMAEYMNIFFEVSDLSKASPATVSRCGMIYMQNDILDWWEVFQSWKVRLENESIAAKLEQLFDGFVDKAYEFVKKLKQYVKLNKMHLAINLMKMIEGLLKLDEVVERCKDATVKIEEIIEIYFLYGLVSTIGCNIDEFDCKKFSEFLRTLNNTAIPSVRLQESSLKISKAALLPESSLPLHSYCIENFRWKMWRDQLEEFNKRELPFEENMRYHEVVIPTTDTLKFTWLLDFMVVKNQYPALVLGPTGIGKTLCVKSFMRSLTQEKYVTLFMGFSVQSTATQTQETFESKIELRKRGVFAPRYPKKLIVFVDDLNMPALESSGAQPPIEFLRQFFDIGGWYSIDKDKKLKRIEDVLLLAAMSPPGGGRNEVTERFMRHFQILTFNSIDNVSLNQVFVNLMRWHVKSEKLSVDLIKPLSVIVGATIDTYNFICEKILPTPEKFYYLFNMRDISRVIQGVQMGNFKAANNKRLIRLFAHEVTRVFLDRFTIGQDKQLIYLFLHKIVKERFHEDLNNVLLEVIPRDTGIDTSCNHEALKYIVFTDIMAGGLSTYERTYDEVVQSKALSEKVMFYLEEYNRTSKKPMNLVMFDFAIEHLLRICRILRMAKGNSLLIGLGGSGRLSLTKLATSICDFNFSTIEITKTYNKDTWHDDLKSLLKSTGGQDKRQVFTLTDSQTKSDFILEDVNNLLNIGEVPSLWNNEEKIEIAEMTRDVAKKYKKDVLASQGTKDQLYDFFVEKVTFNLHIVMTMSPIGNSLRRKMRMFPSLVNCCTIDWFAKWPESGLKAVAMKFLSEKDLPEDLLPEIVRTCTEMHTEVQTISNQLLKEDKRYNYVTPIVYIELIQSYIRLLKTQRETITKVKSGCIKGIEKMQFASKEVQVKQIELKEKNPFLEETNKTVAELINKINMQINEVVGPKKKYAMEEEQLATQQAQEAEKLLADCNQELAKFTPKLKEAQNKMEALTSKEINELKTYKDPPKLVKLVLEAVSILREFPIVYTPKPSNPKELEPNMWATAKRFLTQQNFLSGFATFDYNSIKLEVMEKIRNKYLADLNPSRLKDVSKAAYALCLWIRAIEEYDKAYRIVRPKEIRANEAKAEYRNKMENLKRVQDELQSLVKTLQKMQEDLDRKQEKKGELEDEIEDCKKKIQRANVLSEGLSGEKIRWTSSIEELQGTYRNLEGDMLIAAGIITYLGPFPAKYRNTTIKNWINKCLDSKIKVSENFSLEGALGEPVVIHEWMLNGLPTDAFSRENALIATQSYRWPFMIDPEGQANQWIKNQYNSKKLNTVKLVDDYLKTFKKAIPFGEPLLLENVGVEIDPALDSVLLRQTFKQSGVISIKLGDGVIDYSNDFVLFITTKLRRPHLLPDSSTKVNMIDFALTYDGLKEQLLNFVVQRERQELDEKRTRLVKQNYLYKCELKKREDNILDVLRTTQGNILEDEAAVSAVKESQEAAVQVKEKQQIALETEASIELIRKEYIPIAKHVASVYFTVSNLSKINDMYQYSLTWYLMLFTQAIETAEKSDYVDQRLEMLREQFNKLLYENVVQSLFEKDKLIFSFLLATCIEECNGKLDIAKYNYLTSSAKSTKNDQENPAKPWLPNTSWDSICELASISSETLSDLPTLISDNLKAWKDLYVTIAISTNTETTLPFPLEKASALDKLCIMKALAPEHFAFEVKHYIRSTIGSKFVNYPPFDLTYSFKNSREATPIIFILPGSDPMATLRRFAQDKGKIDTLKSISLGQDQGTRAVNAIEEAKRTGGWVILQNCHLAPSFMPSLERVCDQFQIKSNKEQIHPSFRLWLTSYASEAFPVSVLQSSIKLTNEPPRGSKANMIGSFITYPMRDLYNTGSEAFKRLALSLCFFHALVQERRQFGSLGWNISYEFNQSDMLMSVNQMHGLLSETEGEVALKLLQYLIGECNYGGRVTDDKDRRLLNALVNDFFSAEQLKPDYALAGLIQFTFPEIDSTYQDYYEFIEKKLPDEQPAELYGLHENAFITKNLQECCNLLSSMQKVATSHFQSWKSIVTIGKPELSILVDNREKEELQGMIDQLPEKPFDLELMSKQYPPLHSNSMNAVLIQELTRYNLLLATIRSSLEKVMSAMKGESLMSSEVEEVYNSLIIGKVPDLWHTKSYLSLKSLVKYLADLKVRLNFFNDWVEFGPPPVFWLPGFFFTQSFLTSVLQNFARKKNIEIDIIAFSFEFLQEDKTDYANGILDRFKVTFPQPEVGVYITGLYLEGCRWDFEARVLIESLPKVTFSKAPMIWLKPTKAVNTQQDKGYDCPVYKTEERKGILDSTGHSTNYVMDIRMPTKLKVEHWVKRGVAMICQLTS